MGKLSTVKSAGPLSQADLITQETALRTELAKLEEQMRAIEAELGSVLEGCDHTDANGRSAVVGGSTKVCAHCGKTVTHRAAKLWQ